MADFNPSAELEGVWHLSRKGLAEFDEIIDESIKRFDELHQQQILKEVSEDLDELQGGPFPCSPEQLSEQRENLIRESMEDATRELEIHQKHGPPLICERFSELDDDMKLQSLLATAFTFTWHRGLSQEIRVRLAGAFMLGGSMHIEVEPNSDLARTVCSRLTRWGEEHRLGVWMRTWNKYVGWHLIVAVMLLYVVSRIFIVEGQPLREEAHRILKGGVEASEERRANELVLALLSGYSPPGHARVSPRFYWWTGTIFLLAIMLTYAPRNTLGIGSGEQSIRWQKNWASVVRWCLMGGVGAMLLDRFYSAWSHGLFG